MNEEEINLTAYGIITKEFEDGTEISLYSDSATMQLNYINDNFDIDTEIYNSLNPYTFIINADTKIEIVLSTGGASSPVAI